MQTPDLLCALRTMIKQQCSMVVSTQPICNIECRIRRQPVLLRLFIYCQYSTLHTLLSLCRQACSFKSRWPYCQNLPFFSFSTDCRYMLTGRYHITLYAHPSACSSVSRGMQASIKLRCLLQQHNVDISENLFHFYVGLCAEQQHTVG